MIIILIKKHTLLNIMIIITSLIINIKCTLIKITSFKYENNSFIKNQKLFWVLQGNSKGPNQ